MLKILNLKECSVNVEQAIAMVEIEIENAKKEDVSVIKVLHGYGSGGKGGVIFTALRKKLALWKRKGFINDFFGGDKWNYFDSRAISILQEDKTIIDDDLHSSNPGITIIVI